MGVNLTPIVTKKVVTLENLRGKSFAVDANNDLYQFLALIRTPDGTPLRDSKGNITSHLAGLMYRSTHLMHGYGMRLFFVFDGKPHSLKERELAKRREIRAKATRDWEEAVQRGDYAKAFSKAVMTSRLTLSLIEDAKRLLTLLGIPYIQAPGEAEAQTAYMAKRGDTWASCSRDWDSLLFGAPRLVRYLTISGQEFLPSQGRPRPLEPEVILLDEMLSHHGINREQLVDLAILIGTDFNKRMRGIGPKKALGLIKEYKKLEELPGEIRSMLAEQYGTIRKIFLEPEVLEDYDLNYGSLDEEGLYTFLCDQRGFSRKRVGTVVQRMKEFHSSLDQTGLTKWLNQ